MHNQVWSLLTLEIEQGTVLAEIDTVGNKNNEEREGPKVSTLVKPSSCAYFIFTSDHSKSKPQVHSLYQQPNPPPSRKPNTSRPNTPTMTSRAKSDSKKHHEEH